VKHLLDELATRINSPSFIADDPVQFPRRFTNAADIEIASLLCATIAWGNRTMICRNCNRMLQLMDNQPLSYVLDSGYEDLEDDRKNIHRTFFVYNFKNYMRGLRLIYSRHGSLQEYGRHLGMASDEAPAWTLARGINRAITEANGQADQRCMPQNLDATALKRLNMAFRWLVRNDGIVDLGIWDVITPAQLFIPLDVHVANVSRQFGLLKRKSNDRKAVMELTDVLRGLDPVDPVRYDFALFGLGMEMKHSSPGRPELGV